MTLIEQQIAAALMPLVEDRAYPVTLPQDTPYPALTFNRLEAVQTEEDYRLSPLKQRQARGTRSLFQITAWSKKYSDCVTLLRQCKRELESIDGVYLDNTADGYEHELNLYTCVMEFALWCDLDDTETPGGEPGQINSVMTAIEVNLQQLLPGVDVAQYDPQVSKLSAPSVRLSLNSVAPGIDCGDGRFSANCDITVFCIYPRTGYQSPEIAMRVMDHIRYNHWGLSETVSHPENLRAEAADYRPGKGGYDVWQVSFSQTVYLNIPETEDTPDAESIYMSETPQVGEPNIDHYDLVSEITGAPDAA